MNTLNVIQKLSKVGKILCKILFVFCLVGGIGCAVGIIGLALIPEGLVIGDVTVHSLIESSSEININTCYAAMAVGIIFCSAYAVLSKIAEAYFRNELAAGTPFTFEGSKELFRLGLFAIFIPMGASVIASVVYTILKLVLKDVETLDLNLFGSVGTGILFLLIALLCRYGAEIKEGPSQNKPE